MDLNGGLKKKKNLKHKNGLKTEFLFFLSRNCLVPNKHTEAYINYKLFG